MKGEFKDCGCVYVAYGFDYLIMAAHSALTLKRHNPGLPVTLLTNVPFEPIPYGDRVLFDTVIYRDMPTNTNRRDKLGVDQNSPYVKTLYLDCDTEVWGDVAPVFVMLDEYDIAVRLMNPPTKYPVRLKNGHLANDLSLAEWNAGVLFFRNSEKMKRLFQTWRDLYAELGMARDQCAFMRTVLEVTDIRLLPLGASWNAKPTTRQEYYYIAREPQEIRIFHYREPRRRPEVAQSIYRTFQALDVHLDLSRCSDPDRAVALQNQSKQFAVRYYYYSRFLAPFNNSLGRQLLRWKQGILVAKPFEAFLRLRNALAGQRPRPPRGGGGERPAESLASS